MKRNFPVIAIVICAAGFVAGVVYLFLLRFEAGDVYPPYSSLRADPLGTMALYESLDQLPRLAVRRDFSTANRLPEDKNTTYLHLAAETSEWRWMPNETFDEIEAFVTRGGRLAITFFPVTGRDIWSSGFPMTNSPATNSPVAKGGKKQTKPGAKKKTSRQAAPFAFDEVALEKRWGVQFDRVELQQGDNDVYKPASVVNKTSLPLPATLAWHSALVFTNLDKSWRTIYARGKSAVVIERQFGRGTVVLASDSYFLSNEAMSKARAPALLAWLIGPSERVVFDEAHLGVTETSGVAVLMRKYRLHGVIGGLVLLAVLFIWKNAFSLVPPLPEISQDGFVAGKDAAAGFVNLLRRNISAREILNVCFNEWTKSLLNRGNYTISGVDQAQAAMEAERARPLIARNPVKAYQEICRALKSPALRAADSALRTPHSALKPESKT